MEHIYWIDAEIILRNNKNYPIILSVWDTRENYDFNLSLFTFLELTHRSRSHVGKKISTTAPGSGNFERLDLTNDYKVWVYINQPEVWRNLVAISKAHQAVRFWSEISVFGNPGSYSFHFPVCFKIFSFRK